MLRDLLLDGTSEMLLSVLMSKPQIGMLNHQKYSGIDVHRTTYDLVKSGKNRSSTKIFGGRRLTLL